MARAPLLLALLCACAAAAGSANAAGRKMVGVYELKAGDFSVGVTNWGATITSVVLPDSKGDFADVVLGYDTIGGYVSGKSYFGALVGRVANRIANARFVLDGKAYHLFKNDGNNTLHGGHRGFSQVVWTVKEFVGGGDSPYITLYYHSFDGEQVRVVWNRFPRRPGRVRDVPAGGPLRAAGAHERDGREQGDPGEPGAAHVLEPGRAGQRRRPPQHGAAVRVPVHARGRRPHPDGRGGARGRHALRLPRAGRGGLAHPPGLRRQGRRLRLRHQLRRGRGARGAAEGGRRPGRRVRPGAGAVGQPAWGAVLHGQLPPGRQGEGRQGVPAVRRAVPRDAGVPGRRQPPQFPLPDRQAGAGVQARHGVQVLLLAALCIGNNTLVPG
ncbi:Galactose mutarotase-like superfamily protein [Zea mays]|uniref:Galactose mutarotase-like superfamily protein n=1 Tax=Zea mays TaxID=4577 RepID=A0A1D6E990_MAIZE|nr:Galactose mutarotase-like superfamily protein [Zea mays]